MIRIGLITLAIAAFSAAGTEASERQTIKVQVGGKAYRVSRTGDAVVVARKAVLVRYDVTERDAQRAAVLKATGCEVYDELPSNDGRLRGKLKCPAGR